MAKQLPGLAKQFKAATLATEQERQIAELQMEIERLRQEGSQDLAAQVAELQQKLANSGERLVAIDLIDRNPDQSRRTITNEMVQKRASSLKKYGQITPIVLVAQPNGRYLIEQGELRWRGAKELKWEAIRAVIDPNEMDRQQLHLKTLLDFVHREDLNPLDRAEAIVQVVREFTGLREGGEHREVSTILARVLKRIERQGEDSMKLLSLAVNDSTEVHENIVTTLGIVEPQERTLLLTLLELNQNPSTFKTTLLPLVWFPADLKQAVQIQGLESGRALIISALSAKALGTSEEVAEQERRAVIERVLSQQLTRPQTREIVNQVKASFGKQGGKSRAKPISTLIKAVEEVSGSLKQSSPEELTLLKQQLVAALAEIDRILE